MQVLYDEAKRVWSKTQRKIKCIISIATGIPPLKATGDSSQEILENLIDNAMNTQRVADEFSDLVDHLPRDDRTVYVRLNVAQSLQDVKLEEWKSFGLLIGATACYLNTHRKEIEICVSAIVKTRWVGRMQLRSGNLFLLYVPFPLDPMDDIAKTAVRHPNDKQGFFFGRATELQRMYQVLTLSMPS